MQQNSKSQNTGESVSRIGFKRETGEMTWNTGAPVKYERSGSPTLSSFSASEWYRILWEFLNICRDAASATYSVTSICYEGADSLAVVWTAAFAFLEEPFEVIQGYQSL